MEPELKQIADNLDKIAVLFSRLDNRFAPEPAPRTAVPSYLSGRWKLRDGWMYGR